MSNGRGYITRYRITWLVVLAMIIAATLLLVFGRYVAPVAVEDVKPSIQNAKPPEQEYESEPFEDLIINMNELEMSLSASDGSLKLRVWAREAQKNQSGYVIADGVLQFAMAEDSVLLLSVQDAVMNISTQTVEVQGSLTGKIAIDKFAGEYEQYFEAQQLTWNQQESTVEMAKVIYRAPSFDVTGKSMRLNLLSGEIYFEGAVEAGFD